MIEKTIENWHKHLKGQLEGGLDALLADNVVFYSPVVYTPQKGKEITRAYLNAAGFALGDAQEGQEGQGLNSTSQSGSKFRYVKEILDGNQAMLEFETEINGMYANGADIITCNEKGEIVEFKVMIRPLKAIQAVHAAMGALLKKMETA